LAVVPINSVFSENLFPLLRAPHSATRSAASRIGAARVFLRASRIVTRRCGIDEWEKRYDSFDRNTVCTQNTDHLIVIQSVLKIQKNSQAIRSTSNRLNIQKDNSLNFLESNLILKWKLSQSWKRVISIFDL